MNKKRLSEVFLDSTKEWQIFYKKYFQLKIDLSDLKIPSKKPGFNRLIIIAEGLTLDKVYKVCSNNFSCWKYADNLDKKILNNDRIPQKTYAIWIRDRVEADEELKNLSANELTKKNIQGITLLERLIYELKYWGETKKHLDIESFNLCPGSCDSDDGTPYVSWYLNGLRIDSYSPQGAHLLVRARAVICS